MALRIHFPWGLLLTVAGFAALGAAFAFFIVTDFHGQLYRQCVLHAIGAGLVGVLAWMMSERIAHSANLNTSPFLRLTLPGAAAIYLTAELVSPFTEFTAGSGVLWTDFASVALYLAAGALPVIAGVALMTSAGALLAARRGGVDLKTALRPIFPHVLLGLVLGGVAAYAALELQSNLRVFVLELAPQRVRGSGWLERRQALFTDVLRQSRCDLLIAPFDPADTAGTAPARSLDRPARSLIMRHVAAGIAAQTGLCVVDPTLASRALGQRARAHDWKRIVDVADASGVQWIVRGTVKLDPTRQAYELTLHAFSREAGDKPRWDQRQAVASGPIAFSDELPPEAAFEPRRAEIVERLELPARKPVPPEAEDATPPQLPASPSELAGEAGSALDRAERLQLLAVTYRSSDVDGEHLWERSLMAVAGLPATDERARVVRARAALHLYRRPYALALSQDLDLPEARAVVALAQGNLPEAQAVAQRIRDPLAILITHVELELMRERYRRTAGYQERRDVLLGQHPDYAALLYVPLSSDEWFQPASHELIRRQLGALGVQAQEDAAIKLVRMIASKLGQELFIPSDIERLPVAIERTYAPLWREHAAQWRGVRAYDRLAPWDVFDALYAANRAAVMNSAHSIIARQALPGNLLSFAHGLGQTFAGAPELEVSTARALGQLRAERGNAADTMLAERQRRLLRDLVAWEGGETESQGQLDGVLPPELRRTYLDEPPRAWRPPPNARPNWRQATDAADAAALEANLVHELRSASFAQYSLEPLSESYRLFERLRQVQSAEQMVAHMQARLIGNPAREDFLMQLAEEKGDTPAHVALIEQQIRSQPEEWRLYLRLAQAHLGARQADAAQRALLSYPLLRGGSGNPATLSSHAQEGGDLLLQFGEGELARPLFALAASHGTGSSAQMWSGLRLAQLDDKWSDVNGWSRALYERHKDGTGMTDVAWSSFLRGDGEQGWREFYEGSKQFEDARPWLAAVAGHRIAVTPDDELIAFAKRWKSLSGDAARESILRQQFVFTTLTIDRAPSDKAAAALIAMTASSPDSMHRKLGAGYQAFRRADYSKAIDELSDITKAGINQSQTTRQQVAFTLPYTTASLVLAGRSAEAQVMLDSFRRGVGTDFYYRLSAAYLLGLTGDAPAALDHLWRAQFGLPALQLVSVPPQFQLLETCEKLLAQTNDARYRDLLVDMARRQRVYWPWSWAYAFEAKYATDARERERALGIALYLDPHSEHLAGFSAKERRLAAEWFAKNNPFKDK